MQPCNISETRATRRTLSLAGAAVLAAIAIVAFPQIAVAGLVTPPEVPEEIRVPEGNTAFLVGHAVGTQNYVCLPSGKRFAWTLFTPQATLFDDDGQQITTHFFSPNPSENGAVRPTWQHSRDTSRVWAKLVPPSSTDPDFVEAGAVAWLLLERAGIEEGPDGGDVLAKTTYIHRVNTSGGVAPSTGCSTSANVGATRFIPYTADYVFYRDGE